MLIYNIVFSSCLCPENLVTKIGQFGSLLLVPVGLWDFRKGRGRADREGKGEVSCRINYNIYNVYNIYTILHGGRFERYRFVVLSLVIFYYGFGIYQYFFMFFL